MTDTLGSTFAKYISAEPKAGNKCTDCGSKQDLTILYTTEQGDATRICPACKAKRATEAEARAAGAQARVDEMNRRDAWEEE